VKCKLRKRWLAARLIWCFATTTKKTDVGRKKMNTKKAATNKNSFSFEESARQGSVGIIFCGIHTFKFIDRSIQAAKDLSPPFPAGGMEAVALSELECSQKPAVQEQAAQNSVSIFGPSSFNHGRQA
jgi:hypothetical protein